MDDVVFVSAGTFHTMAICIEGNLWAWGRNDFNQLGDGTSKNRYSPVRVMNDVTFVEVGRYHTLAISNNALYRWGMELLPSDVGTLDMPNERKRIMEDVIHVSTGSNHTLVIKTDDSLWAWGWNKFGQIGNGSYDDVIDPVWIMDNVVSVSAGSNHTLAITVDGNLWAWGGGNNIRYGPRIGVPNQGQVGDGTTKNRNYPQFIVGDVAAISANHTSSLAIFDDGSLWGWGGRGGVGSPRVNNERIDSTIPSWMMDNVVLVSTGTFHSLALLSDGTLWTWGDSLCGFSFMFYSSLWYSLFVH